MKKTLLTLILLTSLSINAQTTFDNQDIIDNSEANGARSVFAADIDGDGDMDMLSASKYDNKIAWYENTDGNGTFGTQQIITTNAAGAFSVFAIDIDGDGDMDVVSASSDDDKIAWYENDGNGTFGTQQIIATSASGVNSIVATDMDGDGDIDVLSSFDNNKIAWYENNGNGTFGTQQIITTNAVGVNAVFASDMDGDGNMDVLSSFDNNIAWYKNNGNGTFGTLQIIATISEPQYVLASDIDGDGDMDVISSSYNKIAWYENTDGTGTFGTQQIITTSLQFAHSVIATDIDGDGDMDVLSASNSDGYDNKIAWYENTDSNGIFGTQQIITTNAIGAASVFASDIDGDGDMDVLSASYGDDKIAWYRNINGNGTFGTQQIITTSPASPNSVLASDIDGDGNKDVLFSSYNKIAWYKNINGNGTFSTPQIITIGVSGTNSVVATDMDGDGDMDVLFALADDNKIAWCENTNGNGIFGAQQTIATNIADANTVYATDIDGDGDIDVISASPYDYTISWYENDGSGTFGSQQIITTIAAYPEDVFATDIDGDGDMDVISASSDDNKIAWYENTDGTGTFGTQQIITTSLDYAYSVFASDMDGDGDMDILSASAFDNKIAWYENTDGNGTFGAQQIITTNADYALSVFATDIDSDGDMDVLSAGDDKIAWYENTDGNGTFGTQQIITTNVIDAASVFASDIDGDGDMDVLSASYGDDKIAWYENLGNHLSINQNTLLSFSVYPTPSENSLNVKSKTEIIKIEIYSKLGQLIKTTAKTKIDISNLSQGIYFVKVTDINDDFGIKKIIKK